jgi:hypothetical protein
MALKLRSISLNTISLSINWCDQSLDLARKKTSDRSIALDQSIARGNSELIKSEVEKTTTNKCLQYV